MVIRFVAVQKCTFLLNNEMLTNYAEIQMHDGVWKRFLHVDSRLINSTKFGATHFLLSRHRSLPDWIDLAGFPWRGTAFCSELLSGKGLILHHDPFWGQVNPPVQCKRSMHRGKMVYFLILAPKISSSNSCNYIRDMNMNGMTDWGEWLSLTSNDCIL